MAGMSLDMGMGGSAFVNGYPGAATPYAANASPQGPTSIAQKAFGIVTGSPGGPRTSALSLVFGGAGSLVLLFAIWWSLPR